MAPPQRSAEEMPLRPPSRPASSAHSSWANFPPDAASERAVGKKKSGFLDCLHDTLVMPLMKYCSRETDDEAETMRKKIVAVTHTLVLFYTVIFRSIGFASQDVSELRYATAVTTLIVSCCSLGYLYVLKTMPPLPYILSCLGLVITVCMVDIDQLSMGNGRSIQFFVIMLDLALVGRVGRSLTMIILLPMVFWLVFTAFEMRFRFGLLDLPGTPAYSVRRERYECEKLPCKEDTPMVSWTVFVSLFLLLFDYITTRNFAETVESEKEMMRFAVSTAHHIAAALVRFDLEEADQHLRAGVDEMPEDLHLALRQLLANLGSYRPFLPDALFPENREPAEAVPDDGDSGNHYARRRNKALGCSAPVSPPAAEDAVLVLAGLREIELPTRQAESAFKRILKEYSEMLAEGVHRHAAYDCGRLGDLGLLIFKTPEAAVRFCLDLQITAADRNWGDDLAKSLLEKSDCSSDSSSPSAGSSNSMCGYEVAESRGVPSVRNATAVHVGELTRTIDDVSNRPQYAGAAIDQIVAMAEASADCAVTVSRDVLTRLTTAMLDEVIMVSYASERPLREYPDILLSALLPKELGAHIDYVQLQLCPAGDEDPRPSHLVEAPNSVPSASQVVIGSVCMIRLMVLEHGSKKSWEELCENTSALLSVIHAHLLRTGGVFMALVNTTVVASWGCFYPCRDHMVQSARFLADIHESINDEWDGVPGLTRTKRSIPPLYCGLTSGPIRCGRVRVHENVVYMMVMGPCVDVCMMLCSAAAELKTQALAVSLSEWPCDQHMSDGVLAPNLRPVDTWRLTLERRRRRAGGGHSDGNLRDADSIVTDVLNDIVRLTVVTVYELRLGGLKNAKRQSPGRRIEPPILVEGRISDDAPPAEPVLTGFVLPASDAWGEDYHRAFAERDTLTLRQWADTDHVVAKVCNLMETGTHLEHSGVFF